MHIGYKCNHCSVALTLSVKITFLLRLKHSYNTAIRNDGKVSFCTYCSWAMTLCNQTRSVLYALLYPTMQGVSTWWYFPNSSCVSIFSWVSTHSNQTSEQRMQLVQLMMVKHVFLPMHPNRQSGAVLQVSSGIVDPSSPCTWATGISHWLYVYVSWRRNMLYTADTIVCIQSQFNRWSGVCNNTGAGYDWSMFNLLWRVGTIIHKCSKLSELSKYNRVWL